MAKVHLTKSFIDSVQAADKRLTFTDDELKGLTLLVTSNQVKTFYLTRKYRGKVERSLLGHFPEMSLKDARSLGAKIRVQYDAGINPAEAKRQAKREPTLNEFFDIYYCDHCQNQCKRPENIKADYDRYLKKTIGDYQLSNIRRADVKEVMVALGDRGKKRTANIVQGLTRAIFNKALAWEYFEGNNPADRIPRYPEKVRTRVLHADEVQRFQDALAMEPDDINRDSILVMLYTGIRKSNVLEMHWKDVDLVREEWTIPMTKNGTGHQVSLTPEALKVLRRRKKNASSVYVFPGRSAAGHLKDVKKAWQRLLDLSGIEDLWVHDLRRTVGTMLANVGANQAQIALQLGHKDYQSAKAYIHPDHNYVKPAVSKVTRILSGKSEKMK